MSDLLHADEIGWDAAPVRTPDLTQPEDLLVAALTEATGYRRVAQQAIQALHDSTRHLERERAAHRRTREEYRALRARIIGVAA